MQTVRVLFFNEFLDRQNLFVVVISIMLKNNMAGPDAECFLPIQYAIFFFGIVASTGFAVQPSMLASRHFPSAAGGTPFTYNF
jgi:hypothetical protein